MPAPFHQRWILLLALGAVATFAAGCGGPTLHPVAGVIRLDGQPLTRGDVVLYPEEGPPGRADRIPQARLDGQGNYTIATGGRTGAPPGSYKVVVVSQSFERPMQAAVNPLGVYPLIDRKFFAPLTTPLRIRVPAEGAHGYDLAVSR